jgi:hypothetical protein
MSRKNRHRRRKNTTRKTTVLPDGMQVVGYHGNGVAKTISSRPSKPFAELAELIAQSKPLPIEIPTKLRPYQQEAVDRMQSGGRVTFEFPSRHSEARRVAPPTVGDIVCSYNKPQTKIPIFRIGIVVGKTNPDSSTLNVAFPSKDGNGGIVKEHRIDELIPSSGPDLLNVARAHRHLMPSSPWERRKSTTKTTPDSS